MSTTTTDLRQVHLRTLRRLSLSAVLSTLLLTHLATRLPLFDSSPSILLASYDGLLARLARPLLRWDAFHFIDIASEGYYYDYEWAFFPGAPMVMRSIGEGLQYLRGDGVLSAAHVLVGGALGSLLCGTTTTLYDLTMHHFEHPSIAYLACLLSLIPSSPATFWFSVYNEPFFTYLSYRGMLYCARSQWFHATVAFALASQFRSNGVMLAGYIAWGLVVSPLVTNGKVKPARVAQAVVFASVVITPFLLHQYRAYQVFCLDSTHDIAGLSSWCFHSLPSVYSHVQVAYWNTGFLQYWTLSQLPNILLAAPVLLSILSFCSMHLQRCGIPMMSSSPLTPQHLRTSPKDSTRSAPFLTASITPHVIHSTALGLTLLFAAHTQIALRLASSLPVTYWAAAWLMVEHPGAGKWWVYWSVAWGAVSIVLWTVFLPPA